MKRLSTRGLTAVLLWSAILSTHAVPSPRLIPFQGRLTDQQGAVYPSGQYTIVFTLYSQAVGGTPLSNWVERHQKVGVINGMVNVFLGSITTLDGVDFSSTIYLGITIDADDNPNTADPEMVPRQMIIPSFWSKNSEKLAGYDWSEILASGNNPVSGQIAGRKIEAASITGSQLVNGTITSQQLGLSIITSNQIVAGSISSANLAPGSVLTTNIADGQVTLPKFFTRQIGTNVGEGGIAMSPYVSTNTPASGVEYTVNEFTVRLVTTGRPVMVVLNGSTNGAQATVSGPINVAVNLVGYVYFWRNGSKVASWNLALTTGKYYDGGFSLSIPATAYQFLDIPPKGTNTYSVSFIASGVNATMGLRGQLLAFEF